MVVTLSILLIVGLTVWAFRRASQDAPSTAVPESLELDSVRDAVMEKLGWSPERAEAARVEYLRFLTLLQRKPGFMVVPWTTAEGQDDLDQFWHMHILDTAKYAADCDRLFGRMIHHNPHVVRGSGQETEAVNKTQRLYKLTFVQGGSADDGAAATSIFAGGGCGSSEGDSHSHSDSGHSCSGHSCGGHGCGGHGCGSSCGGH